MSIALRVEQAQSFHLTDVSMTATDILLQQEDLDIVCNKNKIQVAFSSLATFSSWQQLHNKEVQVEIRNVKDLAGNVFDDVVAWKFTVGSGVFDLSSAEASLALQIDMDFSLYADQPDTFEINLKREIASVANLANYDQVVLQNFKSGSIILDVSISAGERRPVDIGADLISGVSNSASNTSLLANAAVTDARLVPPLGASACSGTSSTQVEVPESNDDGIVKATMVILVVLVVLFAVATVVLSLRKAVVESAYTVSNDDLLNEIKSLQHRIAPKHTKSRSDTVVTDLLSEPPDTSISRKLPPLEPNKLGV